MTEKLLLVCTSGGHFSTMFRLQEFWANHERVWVTDRKQDTQVLSQMGEPVRWLPYQAPRDGMAFLKNLPRVIQIIWQERPTTIVSTGASIAVGFAFFARLLGIKFVYIESISRHEDISLTGKLVYHVAQGFYVQAPELCKRYPKAQFEGYVL